MTHKLIHTPNYLLVVDDSEIKEGGFVLVSCSELDIIETRKVKDYYNEQFLFDGGGQIHMDYCKKIIAHLPLNDSPILEGVDLLPPFSRHQEDGIEGLADLEHDIQLASYENDTSDNPFDFSHYLKSGFITGYNKAKEKYKYTEEDINIMVNNAVVFAESNTHLSVGEYATQFKDFYDKCIQSLSQPKMPVAFECDVKSFEQEYRIPIREVRITTPEGHTQWVGKYIY
jgi:hypothetical protein